MTTAAATSFLATAATLTVPPVSDDGETQWNAVGAEVDALVRDGLPRVNSDPQEAADRVAATVRAVVDDGALYRRIKAIAATGEFDFATIARVLVYAPALWYARHRQRAEEEGGAAVPEAVVERAVAVRNRMARTLRYHFEEHPEERAAVARLTGSRDRLALANELLTAAEVYARREATLRADPQWGAGDAAEARAISSDIRRALGERHVEGVRWGDRVAVLWALVQRDYNELRTLGLWLLRANPEAAKERLPPLVQRSAPRAKPGPTPERVADAPKPANDPAAAEKPANDAEKPADAKPVDAKPVDAKPVEIAVAPAAPVKARPAAKKPARRAR